MTPAGGGTATVERLLLLYIRGVGGRAGLRCCYRFLASFLTSLVLIWMTGYSYAPFSLFFLFVIPFLLFIFLFLSPCLVHITCNSGLSRWVSPAKVLLG